jgi:VWFA-related protein
LLRQARITLYSIDPSGADDFSGHAAYWEGYVKGISKPKQASAASLALQVIAMQSGGLALTIGNDIAAQLQKCLTDTDYYYEISFEPSPAEQKDEYRSLEVRINKPGMTARTRLGYYMQP